MDSLDNTIHIFNQAASIYQEKYGDVHFYASFLQKMGSKLAQNENPIILDLACGPGNMSKYMVDHFPNICVYGIDLAPKMLDIARQVLPASTFEIMDVRAISELDMTFDGILCSFCLPYLNQVEMHELFQDAYQLLVDGGILYISTMQGTYSEEGTLIGSEKSPGQLKTYFFHDIDIVKSLIESGFEVIQKEIKYNEMTKGYEILVLAMKS